jgi:hypothetical protein
MNNRKRKMLIYRRSEKQLQMTGEKNGEEEGSSRGEGTNT